MADKQGKRSHARKRPPKPPCRSPYFRHGGPVAGDRDVECDLPTNHHGDHEERATGARWPRGYDYNHRYNEDGVCVCGRELSNGQFGWRRVRDAMKGDT